MNRADPGDVELVLAVLGFWDQPRCGIANFTGVAHRFACEFDEDLADYPSTYLLRPVSAEELRLECEACEIEVGHPPSPELSQVLPDPIPRFPEAKSRLEELQLQLARDRVMTGRDVIYATAEFRRRETPPTWIGRQLWSVRWTVVSQEIT